MLGAHSNWVTLPEATLSGTLLGGASEACPPGPSRSAGSPCPPSCTCAGRLSARSSLLSSQRLQPLPARVASHTRPLTDFTGPHRPVLPSALHPPLAEVTLFINDLLCSHCPLIVPPPSVLPDNEATENPGLASWGFLTCSRGSGSSSSPRFSLGYPLSPPFSESCGGKVTAGSQWASE